MMGVRPEFVGSGTKVVSQLSRYEQRAPCNWAAGVHVGAGVAVTWWKNQLSGVFISVMRERSGGEDCWYRYDRGLPGFDARTQRADESFPLALGCQEHGSQSGAVCRGCFGCSCGSRPLNFRGGGHGDREC